MILQGFINGKQYNDEPVPATMVAEMFGVADALKKKVIEFTHINIVPDTLNGGKRYPQMLTFPSTFSAIYQGHQIKMTYSTGRTERPEGNVMRMVNLPEELDLLVRRESDSMMPEQNMDLALFWLLHPRNAESPLRDKTQFPLFRYFDKEADNAERNAALDIYDDIMLEIAELCRNKPEVVIRKAKAIKVNNMCVSGVNWELEPKDIIQQTRFGLRELAKVNPIAFKDEWKSPDLELKSLIMFCFDKGIMTAETRANLTKVTFLGNEIASFDHIEDKIVNVQMWVNSNYADRYSLLVKSVKEAEAKAVTEQVARAYNKKQKAES